MSHNHNHSKDSRFEEQPTVRAQPMEDESVHESPIQDTPIVKESSPTVSDEASAEKLIVSGTVTDCVKLNVRSEPDGTDTSNVITTIDALTEVEVDMKESTDTFFKIRTADGIEGFCMREYIFLHQ